MSTDRIRDAELGRLANRIQEAAGGYIHARERFDKAQAALNEARKDLLKADSAFAQACIDAGVYPVDDTEMYLPFRGALWALTLRGEPDPGRSSVTNLVRIVTPAELIAEFRTVISSVEYSRHMDDGEDCNAILRHPHWCGCMEEVFEGF